MYLFNALYFASKVHQPQGALSSSLTSAQHTQPAHLVSPQHSGYPNESSNTAADQMLFEVAGLVCYQSTAGSHPEKEFMPCI